MLDVSCCCTEGARESVVQGSSVKRAFGPSWTEDEKETMDWSK
jgi:hypothetical protein